MDGYQTAIDQPSVIVNIKPSFIVHALTRTPAADPHAVWGGRGPISYTGRPYGDQVIFLGFWLNCLMERSIFSISRSASAPLIQSAKSARAAADGAYQLRIMHDVPGTQGIDRFAGYFHEYPAMLRRQVRRQVLNGLSCLIVQ